MFAVIKTGGKQYKVAKDDVIVVEKLPGEAGSEVRLDQVLMLAGDDGANVGTPLIDGATVSATVVEQRRADKVIVFKRKRRKNYRRTKGHRQEQTVLRIIEILEAGAKPAAAKKPAAKKAKDAEAKTKKPAAKKPAAEKAETKKPAAKKAKDEKAETEKPAAKKPAAKKAEPKTEE